MITQKEIREIALADMIASLKSAKQSAKLGGFGWEVDDDLCTLIEQAEHAYQEELDS
jgi:hypothetical protein